MSQDLQASPWSMHYRVTLFESDEGWSVSCPDLPGCHSQGATREEVLAPRRTAATCMAT